MSKSLIFELGLGDYYDMHESGRNHTSFQSESHHLDMSDHRK